MDYDQARQHLVAVATFLESTCIRQRRSYRTGDCHAEKIDTGSQEEAGTAWHSNHSYSLQPLPHPTPLQFLTPDRWFRKTYSTQRNRSSQALQAIAEQIEQRVTAQSERSESLPRQKKPCIGLYKIEQLIIKSIRSVFPIWVGNILRSSLQVADQYF